MQQERLFANFSLSGFCERALALYRENSSKFVTFVLGGLDGGRQVVVDPIVNAIGDRDNLLVRRDYDSLLGITKHIRVRSSLTIYPVAKREDTLNTNLYLSYTFTKSDGEFNAPIHKVPNLCIGIWGTRNMIRVILPALYSDTRSSPFLSQEEQKTFYEKGLLPAMKALDENLATQWPASYNDEMFRARGRNGQLSFQTKIVGDWLIDELGDAIRGCLEDNDCPWGIGLVFLHQIRGVKQSSQHPLSPISAQDSLIAFLRQNQLLDVNETSVVPLTSSENSQWWIDVGVDVASSERRSLAWRTDAHSRIVQSICQIDARNAERITTLGSSQYKRDISSHLPAVSGCRINPGPRATSHIGVKYLQAYTTDKALIYRLDQGHHGKFITPIDLLNGKGSSYANQLYNLYRNASEGNHSLARLEARVPIEQGTNVLLNLSADILYASLLSFDTTAWWSLRAYRCLALKHILEWQEEGEDHSRAHPDAILLTAACSWTLNGLHSTPDTGASYKELISAILPHVERANVNRNILLFGTPLTDDGDLDSDGGSDEDARPLTIPAIQYGLLFFRPLRIGPLHPVPRFKHSNAACLSNKTFQFFFGFKRSELLTTFFRTARIAPADPTRVKNKAKRTPAYVNWGQDTDVDVFDLALRGHRLASPARDEGSDLELEDAPQEENDIDKMLTNVWRQFLLDITSKAPNTQYATGPPYIVLTQAERTAVNEATYKNTRLSVYFRDCQWKHATQEEWTMIFRRLWPKKGDLLSEKAQNYNSTLYFREWHSIMSKADAATVKIMRDDLKSRFDKLYWMPFAQTDRIWRTTYHNTFRKTSGQNRRAPAPQILICPDEFDPDW